MPQALSAYASFPIRISTKRRRRSGSLSCFTQTRTTIIKRNWYVPTAWGCPAASAMSARAQSTLPPIPRIRSGKISTRTLGSQYFWVDRIFFWDRDEANFIYQLFHTSLPGTLDTSLVSTDYINNPRTMNAVYSVHARLRQSLATGEERLNGSERDNKQFQDYPQTAALSQCWDSVSSTTHTMRVLKDGADSVGTLGALNRVYLN